MSLITRIIIVILLILSVADVQYLKTDDEISSHVSGRHLG